MKIIRTELSGFGHYGICSLVPQPIVEAFRQNVKSHADWEYPEFDFCRTGIEHSLVNYQYDDGPYFRLGWAPSNLPSAMKSVRILDRYGEMLPTQQKRELFNYPSLEVTAYPNSNGWDVKANFGNPIWDLIESGDFPSLLPGINTEILNWWKDQSNTDVGGQLTTVFKGVNGITLQVYQPSGNGLWIVGSRNDTGGSYQIHDHNTDGWSQAFAHVFSLCVILKHCRRHLGLPPITAMDPLSGRP